MEWDFGYLEIGVEMGLTRGGKMFTAANATQLHNSIMQLLPESPSDAPRRYASQITEAIRPLIFSRR